MEDEAGLPDKIQDSFRQTTNTFCISISYKLLKDHSLFLFEIQVSLGILYFLLLNLATIKKAKTIFTVNVLGNWGLTI